LHCGHHSRPRSLTRIAGGDHPATSEKHVRFGLDSQALRWDSLYPLDRNDPAVLILRVPTPRLTQPRLLPLKAEDLRIRTRRERDPPLRASNTPVQRRLT